MIRLIKLQNLFIPFYRLNYPLNRDLAVNEEFDCTTIEDENSTPLNYQKSTDPVYYNFYILLFK